MASTSFSESFKYGSRLFGLFLVIVIFGGGGLGLGAVLAVPEIQAWLDTGSAETAEIAGGLVLAVLGFSILVIGHFGMLYKLIADGVSKGTADPAVDIAAGPEETAESEETADSQGGQQPTQPPEPAESQKPSPQPEADQPSTAAEPAQPTSAEQPPEQRDTPTETNQPADAATEPTQPADTSTEQPAEQTAASEQPAETAKEDGEQAGREQTAEEIVFGSTDDDGRAEDEPAEPTGDVEFDEETGAENREDIETAGNPSSDPLADNFDDE